MVSRAKRASYLRQVAIGVRQGKKVSDIAKSIGISSQTAGRYRAYLVKAGIQLPETTFDAETHPFLDEKEFRQIPSVKTLERECRTSDLEFKNYLNPLLKVCRTVSGHPDKLLTDFQTSEEIFLEFLQVWEKENRDQTPERYRKAVRKFMDVNGIQMKTRAKILKGGSDSTGGYSDIKLSNNELNQVLLEMEKHGGIIYKVLLGINHEMFPRPESLWKWKPRIESRYIDVDGKSYEYGACEVYEQKQDKKYKKMILDPDILGLVKELPNRPIIDEPFGKWQTKYCKLLRNAFYEIGKIDRSTVYKKGDEGYYWENRPIYSIRHSSAVQWMRRTAFNAALVSNMGWEDPKTLSQFYASTTVEQIMEAGQCWYCRPPAEKKGDSLFCSASHALAYLNGGRHQ